MGKNKNPTTVDGQMNLIQIDFCKKVTHKINKLPISQFFKLPNADRGKSTDLERITDKLDKNEYTSVEQWKDDMNSLWKHVLKDENHKYKLIAKELSTLFRSYTEIIPRNEDDNWLIMLKKEHTKLCKIIEAKPRLPKGPTRILLRAPAQK